MHNGSEGKENMPPKDFLSREPIPATATFIVSVSEPYLPRPLAAKNPSQMC
jgi:hypothetical protein